MPDLVKSKMILSAGPYRSGTNDDPTLIRNNVEEMESYYGFYAGNDARIGATIPDTVSEMKAFGENVGPLDLQRRRARFDARRRNPRRQRRQQKGPR
jgi:hypothetical protein